MARKSRFRTLAKACRDLGIRSLLLAHHEDDKAETILMRLANGHRGIGLVGIRDSGGIPECYGLHGIYESGGLDVDVAGEGEVIQHVPKHTKKAKHSQSSKQLSLPIENGGIKVYRPLIGFSKDRLIATCQAEKMPWFEDVTNKDPSLTPRNAIRHLFRIHNMPTALSKPRLLALSKRLQEKRAIQLSATEKYLADCKITDFNTRTATLRIRFADLSQDFALALDDPAQFQKPEIAALLLKRIITLITPRPDVRSTSLHGAVETLFPEITGSGIPSAPAAYTVAGVMFRQLPTLSQSPSPSPVPGKAPKPEWLLSRQPHSAPTTKPRTSTEQPEYPPLPTPALDSSVPWSSWQLYDGRFWIRVRNGGGFTLSVRPYRKEDASALAEVLSGSMRSRLKLLLRRYAPGDVRWSLPALVVRGEDGAERVVGLPTLDVGVRDIGVKATWEVRYKKVDLNGVGIAT